MYTYDIEHSPAYASLRVKLATNQSLIVEAGAMAAMDSHITMKSKMRGGMMKSVGRMFGGESLFLSEFTATGKPGELLLDLLGNKLKKPCILVWERVSRIFN